MAFVDPVTLHNPSSGSAPPNTWGDQLRDNDMYLYERGPYICTSGTRPGAPAEGYVIYETDTDRYYSWNGSAWVLSSATGAFYGSWTPVVTQSGTVTTTETYCNYTRTGRLVTGWFRLTVTGSGTINNLITVSTPITAANGNSIPVGTGYLWDDTTDLYYPTTLVLGTQTTFRMLITNEALTTFAGENGGGTSFAFALVASDRIAGTFTYEAAASA